MDKSGVKNWTVLLATLGCLTLAPGGACADELNVENLPKDPKEYRQAIEKIIVKVNALVEKQKNNKQAESSVLDVLQVRDNIFRELPKVEKTVPDGAKWWDAEGRSSVDKMLQLLKLRYDKLASIGG
jgi:hypothetical protein